VVVASALVACIDDPPPPKTPVADDTVDNTGPTLPTSSHDSHPAKLEIEDVVVGQGAEAKVGDAVRVDYVGKLENGTVFDSSIERKTPFAFILGEGKVIKGWEQGVVGMKVGGKRKLTIPPQLGYGAAGSPPNIPPNATLYFDIELLNVAQ
jgi:FKBP-type peptidyl-prolyl cis-trans isomerase